MFSVLGASFKHDEKVKLCFLAFSCCIFVCFQHEDKFWGSCFLGIFAYLMGMILENVATIFAHDIFFGMMIIFVLSSISARYIDEKLFDVVLLIDIVMLVFLIFTKNTALCGLVSHFINNILLTMCLDDKRISENLHGLGFFTNAYGIFLHLHNLVHA